MKWIAPILVLAVVLIAGCTQNSTPSQSQSTQTSVQSNQCPIEDSLKTCLSQSSIKIYVNQMAFWSNCNSLPEGYKLYYTDNPISCKKGSDVGQNPNYYYCSPYPILQIGKDVLNTQGVIQEKIRYNIDNVILDSSKIVISIECKKA